VEKDKTKREKRVVRGSGGGGVGVKWGKNQQNNCEWGWVGYVMQVWGRIFVVKGGRQSFKGKVYRNRLGGVGGGTTVNLTMWNEKKVGVVEFLVGGGGGGGKSFQTAKRKETRKIWKKWNRN